MINRQVYIPLKSIIKWDWILSSGKLYLGIVCLLASISGVVFKLFEGQTIAILAMFGIVLVSTGIGNRRIKL